MRNDKFNSIVFLFQSRINHNSPRFIPLFLETNRTRLVIFHGLKFPKSDRIMLKLFVVCERLFSFKFRHYKWCHVMSPKSFIKTNQILHIDDPTYSEKEIQEIDDWISRLRMRSQTGFVIVTNEFTQRYFCDKIRGLRVEIVEQGFTELEVKVTERRQSFACVYSSPFIDYGGDRHASHSTWGAKVLFDEIVPLLVEADPMIEVHLIGRLGNDARKKVAGNSNIFAHGYLDRYENTRLMQSCHVAIYPRKVDHLRAVQKVAEYIGAGLPIVTFRLVDTELVTRHNLGITVENSLDFAKAILSLKHDKEKYERYKKNIVDVQYAFSWQNLAKKMESKVECY